MVSSVRLLATALAMTFSVSATAQKSASSKPLPHFDFKGITATTTLAEATPKLKSVEAYFGSSKGGDLVDDTISGTPALISAVFDDQGLVVMNGHPVDYQETKNAFIMKWGKPSESISYPMQNGFGAKIVSETIIWDFAEGRLTLEDGAFRGNPSFSYDSNRQIQAISDRSKVKVDF